MIYLDCNATTPLHHEARRAWLDVAERAWHNPSGLYAAATAARDILDDCRDRLAGILDCDPARIVFTAGATAAANSLARHVAATAAPGARGLLSAIEHPCMAESFQAAMPGRLSEIPVDHHGCVTIDAVEAALNAAAPLPAIVSVMAASNDSGTIQPWQAIAAWCRGRGTPFLTDAAQWLGKIPARGLGACDWIIGSGHKFGGPKGVGFLLMPARDASFSGDRGGPQEGGRHAGTENIASIAAMVAALEARERDIASGTDAHAAARDAAVRRIRERLPGAVIVGEAAARLWNTITVVIPGADGKKIVARLDRAGIAASTGSACSAGAGSSARVLTAIGAKPLGLAEADLRGMVRLSGGWETTPEEWISAADALIDAAHEPNVGKPHVSLSPLR
ncbi:MAG: cysteine desulfurase family protein [Planctomycetia bacterium]